MAETRRRDTAKREQPVETVVDPQPEPLQAEPEPKVTAILVAYNQAAVLRRAIEALERSRDRELLEILVVDCGSNDDSRDLDAEYPGVTILRLPHHLGATKAMNIGARTAKAEMVFYLSPLIEVEPTTVMSLAERLEADTEVAAACPLLLDADGNVVSKKLPIPGADALASVCAGGALSGPAIDTSQDSVAVDYVPRDAILLRKQFVKGMNYFDQRFGHHWAEADLAMKIRNAQRKIRIYPSIRAIYRAAEDPLAGDSLVQADCALSAAAFLAKYQGFGAALSFRLGAIFKALGRLNFKMLGSLISGQKLDGSQVG
jgi:GT2 family glycosyltransferase